MLLFSAEIRPKEFHLVNADSESLLAIKTGALLLAADHYRNNVRGRHERHHPIQAPEIKRLTHRSARAKFKCEYLPPDKRRRIAGKFFANESKRN